MATQQTNDLMYAKLREQYPTGPRATLGDLLSRYVADERGGAWGGEPFDSRANAFWGAFTSTNYVDTVATDTPLMHLRLNELSGTTAEDTTSNNRDGTYLNTPTLGVASKAPAGGTAITLTPASFEAVRVDFGAWMEAQTFTVEFWFKTTMTTAAYLSTHDTGLGTDRGLAVILNNLAADKVDVQSDARLGPTHTSTNTGWRDGNWHHFVWTYAVSDGVSKIYKDGVLDSTVVLSSGFDTGGNPWFFGLYGNGTSFGLNGSLDELAFYGTRLDAARVLAHYEAMA